MNYIITFNWYLISSFLLALILPFIFIKIIHPILRKIIEKKNKKLFTNLVKIRFFYSLGYIISPLVLLLTLNNMQISNTEYLEVLLLIKKFSGLWVIISFAIIVNKFLSSISKTFSKNTVFIKYPINSYLQLVKLVIVIISAILAICIASSRSSFA